MTAVAAVPKPVEKLDKVYFCVNCRAVFLFKSDLAYHSEKFGHKEFQFTPFDDEVGDRIRVKEN
jgi:hypothetical protein